MLKRLEQLINQSEAFEGTELSEYLAKELGDSASVRSQVNPNGWSIELALKGGIREPSRITRARITETCKKALEKFPGFRDYGWQNAPQGRLYLIRQERG